MIINNVSLGADPELFLRNEDDIVSAIGLIGGSKDEPIPISEKGHFIQEDNVLVEYNIPPSMNKEEFVSNIKYCMDYISELATIHNLTISDVASHMMDPKYLNCKQSQQFSCERDANAYTQSLNPIIDANTNLRSAGKMAARLHRNM